MVTGTVVCPQCGRVAEVELGTHPFCRQCDYPLFWQLPREQPAAPQAAAVHDERAPTVACPACNRLNDATRTFCDACGAVLRPAPMRVRRTWVEPEELRTPPSRRRRWLVRIALLVIVLLLAGGTAFAVWHFLLRRSPWTVRTLDVGQATWDISQTIGLDGNPVIVYVDAADFGLRALKCAVPTCNGSQSANTITRLTSVGNNGQGEGSAVAIGSDGRPIISFRNADTHALTVLHCGDPSCSDPGSATITQLDPPPGTSSATADAGADSSIAIGADHLPIISYHDTGLRALKVAHCENVACTKAQISIVARTTSSDPSADVGASTQIAIGADGLPVIAYRDDGQHALDLVRCSNVACTEGVIVTLVKAPNLQPGFENSMVLDSNLRPLIAYHDKSNDGIYLVHCDDPQCSQVTRTAVDVHPYLAEPTLALTRAGLPVIAFRQSKPGDETGHRYLRFVQCNDLACKSHTAATVVDGAGRAGYSPAIVVLSNNTIGIAYGDATNGSLKYATRR